MNDVTTGGLIKTGELNQRYALYQDPKTPNNFLASGGTTDYIVLFEDLYEASPRKIYAVTADQFVLKATGSLDQLETIPVKDGDMECHFTQDALELSAKIVEEKIKIQAEKEAAAHIAAEYALPPLPATDMKDIAAAERIAIADNQSPSIIGAINLAGYPRDQFDFNGIDQTAIDTARVYIHKAKADSEIIPAVESPRAITQTEWYEVPAADEQIILAEPVSAAAPASSVIFADAEEDVVSPHAPLSIDPELADILTNKLNLAVEFALNGDSQSARDLAEEVKESAETEGYKVLVAHTPKQPISVSFIADNSPISFGPDLIEQVDSIAAIKAVEPPEPLNISEYSSEVIGGALEILDRLQAGTLPLPPTAAGNTDTINLTSADQVDSIRSILRPDTRTATTLPLTKEQNTVAYELLYAANLFDATSQNRIARTGNDDALNAWVIDVSNQVMSEIAAKQAQKKSPSLTGLIKGLFRAETRVEASIDDDLAQGYESSAEPDIDSTLISEETPAEIIFRWDCKRAYLVEANNQQTEDNKRTPAQIDAIMAKHIAKELAENRHRDDYKIALQLVAIRDKSAGTTPAAATGVNHHQDTSRASFIKAADPVVEPTTFEPTQLMNPSPAFQNTELFYSGPVIPEVK